MVQWTATAWEILREKKICFSATGIIAAGDCVKVDLIRSNAYEKTLKDLMEELNTEVVDSEDEDPFAQFGDENEEQWHSYTRTYQGLCPRKIRWCPGKNNLES